MRGRAKGEVLLWQLRTDERSTCASVRLECNLAAALDTHTHTERVGMAGQSVAGLSSYSSVWPTGSFFFFLLPACPRFGLRLSRDLR